MPLKLVIVGGVAGGASAATSARRADEAAEIVVFERGPDVSFNNCGLPYYVGDVIDDRDKLIVTSPERMRDRYRIDVRVRTSVESIDRARKVVRARDLASGREYDEPYDKLILSPGAAPTRPDVPGADLPGIHTLRDLRDVDRIRGRVDAGIRRAVVIGGGYIGLEVAENLARRGVATTLVQSQGQVLSLFDAEMTTPIAEHLAEHGIELILGDSAEAFEEKAGGIEVRLRSGGTRQAQLVVVGVGVRPETGLAVAAGLALGPKGGIRVDEHLRTDDPDIYAVGDAIEVEDYVLGGPTLVPLAGPANRQGRLAAAHICGEAEARYRGTQGTAIVGVFGKTAAMTGASEKALRKANRPFRKVYVHANNHAGYMPGAEPISLKLLFEPEGGKILGAQAVGGSGVDKRIDVLAMAIQAGMTAFDLEESELAYAPQFGAAKDPVNMAGFVAGGLLRGEHPQVDVEAVLDLSADRRPLLLDVRSPDDFMKAHLPGAVNLPLDEIRDRLDQIPRDREIATYCQSGQNGHMATRILLQSGFRAANIGGGFKTYRLHHPAPDLR
ncbi:FAD-dependent oxidoreductase [Tundrisphaera sp. TA3]|uniref:FAD-dependent oxidoreductase n=1 Tax=Tundrisphaera sp. TA3 TaxID=3435775 RepID=UPI003EBDE458